MTGLSQEHGTVTFAPRAFPHPGELAIGDLMLIWPVHACLTANLMGCRIGSPVRILS